VKAYGAEKTDDEGLADGWTSGAGPHISPEPWPRLPDIGGPMGLVLVARLPREYQRRGPAFPGVAFFGEVDQGFEEEVGGFAPTARAIQAEHPQASYFRDIIDGFFALIWLTEAELAGDPVPDPSLPHDEQEPGCVFRWVRIDDPNAGLAPSDDEASLEARGYLSPENPDEEAREPFLPWAEPLINYVAHLGGTCFPAQGVPEGLSPYYLEFAQEFVQLNIGTGVAQLDLERNTFTWSC
jgi:hypothetical protein